MTVLATPTPLTFPPHLFAKLSPRAYQTAHLTHAPSLRPSGRSPTQSRPITCNAGSLTHAHGSAVVRCGDTAVVCGVRGEILRAEDCVDYTPRLTEAALSGAENEEQGLNAQEEEWSRKRKRKNDTEELAALSLLVPNIELATGCSPAHLPGGPPGAEAQVLTQRLLSLLHTSQTICMEPLRIWHHPAASTTPTTGISPQPPTEVLEPTVATVKAFWTLHISLVFISLDGGALDTAWLALLAALKTTWLPRAWYEPDMDQILCSPEPGEETTLSMELGDAPIAMTFGIFEYDERDDLSSRGGAGQKSGKGKVVLADPDAFEEALCKENVTVTVGGGGKVVRIEKSGGGAGSVEDVRACVEVAGERRRECLGVLERVL